MEEFETEVLSKTCKKTCIYDTFKEYCRQRLSMDKGMRALYGHPVFRQFKYLAYCKVKSSEDKFKDKIQKTFSKASIPTKKTNCLSQEMLENAQKETDDMVIGWGNWGKNPNALKGKAPTPGIGIRRRFESKFETMTINEHNTSQECPCCN